MRIKREMVLSEIGGVVVAVPVGESAELFHGIVRLNRTGADIWEGLSKGLNQEEIAAGLVQSYKNVDFETALKEVNKVVAKLAEADLLEV